MSTLSWISDTAYWFWETVTDSQDNLKILLKPVVRNEYVEFFIAKTE